MSQATDAVPSMLAQEDPIIQELIRNKQDLENRQFIDKTLNEFSNLMLWRRDDDYARWTERILDALALKLPVLQAVLYTGDYDQDQLLALEWIGAFAYDAQQRIERWPLGEGLIGQAAQSQRRFWIEEGVQLPEHVVASGLRLQPAALLIEPLIYNERTEGVLEISFSVKPDAVALELLHSLGRILGANLLTIRNQQQMQRLYGEMRQKSEALAAQEEEMRQNLEEMVATQEELRHAKEEIERRQQQFDRIANNVPGVLYQYFMDLSSGRHGFLYATSRTLELFGVAPESITDVEGNPLTVHPDEQEAFARSVLESAEKLTPYTWQGRIRHLETGEFRWYQADSTPRKEREDLIIWDGYLQDITAKRAKDLAIEEMNAELAAREEELKQSLEEMAATQEELNRAKEDIERRQYDLLNQRALLDSVIDNMSNTLVAIDKDFNLLFVNEIVRNNYRTMGMEVQPGMPLADLLPPGQKEFYENAYKRAFAGESFNILNFFQMNDMEFRFSIDYYPLRNAQGEIVGAVAAAIDLNQKQEIDLDASLRLDALERSLSVAGALSLGFDESHQLFVIDEDGSWKATGRGLRDLVSPPDYDRLLKSVNAVAQGQAILLQNVELTDAPGSDTHFWLVPNRADSGIPRAVGVILILGAQQTIRESLSSMHRLRNN